MFLDTCSISMFMFPGHPPLEMSSHSFRRVVLSSENEFENVESNRDWRETLPSDVPISYDDMVLILKDPIRPAPLWMILSLTGVEDPVRMSLPFF